MKTKILFFTIVLFMLVGCANDTNEESTTASSDKSSASETTEEETAETNESTAASESESNDVANNASSVATVQKDSDSTSSENSDSKAEEEEDKETLSQYSNEQIEFARVWLQLGPNQALDELNVTKIPAGSPINPIDETSAKYPVDVIQLAGARLVDGSVTYSGNGDGTINVYNVPLSWETNVPEDLDEDYMRNYTQSIIDDAALVYVDPGNDEEVIELIELLNVQY